jgi:hypothetical protein
MHTHIERPQGGLWVMGIYARAKRFVFVKEALLGILAPKTKKRGVVAPLFE